MLDFLLQMDPKALQLPVKGLSRVCLQEHNRNVLLYGCSGGTNEVEVVEEPRKGRMIDASPRLERLVWLYYPNPKTT
jgi:hypothetical protein